jgi:hypothetical protein
MKRGRRQRVETTPAVTAQVSGYAAVTLHFKDGTPLQAGDIKEGATVTFDRSTGEVLSITQDHQRSPH